MKEYEVQLLLASNMKDIDVNASIISGKDDH
jgi:hypothetical protein